MTHGIQCAFYGSRGAGPGAELSDTLTVTDSRGWQGRLITQSKRETWKDLRF